MSVDPRRGFAVGRGSTSGGVHRLGLRTAIMLAFAVGGLVLSAAMALGTYLASRHYLIDQREHTALRQAYTDASFVRDGLLTSGAEVSDVLGALSPPADATIIVRRGDRWFSSSLRVGEDDIPQQLLDAAADGSASMAWQRGPDGPALMVEVPLPAVGAQYYERVSTRELADTLDALRIVLAVFAALTAMAAAALGGWAARRVVAPLDAVAGAAARIASGSLDTRLASTDDPDLTTIVASFNSMVDALHERIERDARFAADVSHELRSPLTALVTSVEVLGRRRDELPDRAQQALTLIARDLARFQRAVEDLLDLGRLEAGAAALVLETIDARDLLMHAAEATGVPAELLRLPPSPVPSTMVRADKTAIHRAVVNLLENAQRHGGGVTEVALEARPGSVVVTIDDHGPGVVEEDRIRIFDRFVRGGSRGSLPGTGLGLSIVAETVRAHGGAVWGTSRPDGPGARFVMQLPSQIADAEREQVASPANGNVPDRPPQTAPNGPAATP